MIYYCKLQYIQATLFMKPLTEKKKQLSFQFPAKSSTKKECTKMHAMALANYITSVK